MSLVLGTAAFALIRIHPYELSYYNELIGGPRGAWERGFELTYWYDAFNGPVIDELNRKFPPNARVGFLNDKTLPVTFQELQTLGEFRGDIEPPDMDTDQFSYAWLLTQDSKASSFTRLLFAMRPWYASEPRQLDGAARRFGRRPGRGFARLGLADLARRPRSQQARPARGPGPGPEVRSLAWPPLGRRIEKGPSARCESNHPRTGRAPTPRACWPPPDGSRPNNPSTRTHRRNGCLT